MRFRIAVDGPELFFGLVALGVSAGYLYEASRIPQSLLEDAVGARGLPVAVGWAMAVLALIQCGRGIVSRTSAENSVPPPTKDDPRADARHRWQPRWLALSLLAILCVYVAILPYSGYIASTALLIAAVARVAGAAFSRSFIIIAIVGSVVLWLLFDPLLGIGLPAGSWWGGQ